MKFIQALGIIAVLAIGPGASLAQSTAPETGAAQTKTVKPSKHPELAPILNGIHDQLERVDLARAHGKLTNQQAAELERKINGVHGQMVEYFKANRKAKRSRDLTPDQIQSLKDMLDKTSLLIPEP